MPSTAVSRLRRPDGGKHAGNRRRQPRELTPAQLKLRQDTLTQMGWLAGLGLQDSTDIDLSYEEETTGQASSEIGGSFEEAERHRPSKRRRITRASLSPAPASTRDIQSEALVTSRSHSSPGPLKDDERNLETCELLPILEAARNHRPDSTSQNDRVLMPPPFLPKTPSRRTKRTYVPSSQSPDVTPLSLRTAKTVRQAQRSPLKDKSANVSVSGSSGFIKPPNPFQRFAKAEIPSSGAADDLDDAQGRSKQSTKNVSHLQLEDQNTPRPRRTTTLQQSRDVQANASSFRAVLSDSASDASPESETKPRSRLPVPFSQASTQDPTQHTSDPPLPVLPANTSNTYSQPVILDSEPNAPLARVPSSQATTQLPTQFQPSNIQRRLLLTERISNVDEDPPVQVQVRSSQATTVAPSSDPASEDTEQTGVQLKRRKADKSKERPAKAAKSQPMQQSPPDSLTTSQALNGWEWDGKDWTESQMLPPSLMDFTLPDLLPPSGSQASMSSLDGNGAVLTQSDRPESKARPWNIAGSHESGSDGRQRLGQAQDTNDERCRSPKRASKRDIKKEPNR